MLQIVMSNLNSSTIDPVIFLGVAERYKEKDQNKFPAGNADFINLSLIKTLISYPSPLNNRSFIFLIHKSYCNNFNNGNSYIEIKDPSGNSWIRLDLSWEPRENTSTTIENFGKFDYPDWHHIVATLSKGLIPIPGIYNVFLVNNKKYIKISDICFNYMPSLPLSAGEMQGLRSRLFADSTIKINIRCDNCDDQIDIYTAFQKTLSVEKEGAIWYQDVDDTFKCSCGNVNQDLTYCKESLHGYLRLSNLHSNTDNVSYERLYSHRTIHKIVESFFDLLENEVSENEVQKYIEDNPVLLAPFNAKKIYHKPPILNKYVTDFVILDSNDNLIFIEIEKPSMGLFKKNGHPRAELTHAYEQVKDWLLEYKQSSNQILEKLGLKNSEINAVSGFVIAGILENSNKVHYRNHQKKETHNDIGFITFDELGSSVLNLSKELI